MHSSIWCTSNYDVFLRIYSHLAHFIPQLKHFWSFYALLFALKTHFKAENVAFLVKIPSWRSTAKCDHWAIDNIIVQFSIWLKIFRNVTLFLCKFFQVYQFYALIGTKTDQFSQRFIKICLSACVFPLICFELFSSIEIPQFESCILMWCQQMRANNFHENDWRAGWSD